MDDPNFGNNALGNGNIELIGAINRIAINCILYFAGTNDRTL